MKRKPTSKLISNVIRRNKEADTDVALERSKPAPRFVAIIRSRSSALEALRSKSLLDQQVASLTRAE